MASADFSQQLLSVYSNTFVRPPAVRQITFIPCTRIIYTPISVQFWDFVLFCKLIQSDMPDNVRVPRVGTLPPASFRFHLAVDTLALG